MRNFRGFPLRGFRVFSWPFSDNKRDTKAVYLCRVFLPLFLPLCAGMISSEYVATKSEGYKRAKTLSYFSGGFRCFGGRLVWSASRSI